MKRFAPYLKAVVAFVAPVLTDLAATIQVAGPFDFVGLARRSCVYLITAMVVWAVPNEPATTVAFVPTVFTDNKPAV